MADGGAQADIGDIGADIVTVIVVATAPAIVQAIAQAATARPNRTCTGAKAIRIACLQKQRRVVTALRPTPRANVRTMSMQIRRATSIVRPIRDGRPVPTRAGSRTPVSARIKSNPSNRCKALSPQPPNSSIGAARLGNGVISVPQATTRPEEVPVHIPVDAGAVVQEVEVVAEVDVANGMISDRSPHWVSSWSI